ncbi:hypothetical protein AMK59_907, partial [Oryctes borbonicus]
IALAGSCWTTMASNNRCTELLSEESSRENCCAHHHDGVSRAWSDENFDSGTLFFWRVLGGGVKCKPCMDTCDGVQCESGKVCVVRKGHPKCICSPKCNVSKKISERAPICGSDGRTYKNICRLKKRACRKRSNDLSVAYYGTCQNSCDKITCPSGRVCLLDQNLSPHCIKCARKCPPVAARHQVCGADGVTYQSTCHLKDMACKKGKGIPLAYKGPCHRKATCSKIRCKETQNCLVDKRTGMPRCVTCVRRCKPRHMRGPICGSNNSTYQSWCHMMQDACSKGYVLETQHSGKCVTNDEMF